MNLYAINFTHYAPKDGKEGIITYLVATDDEQVYQYIKSEPEINGSGLYNSYKYNEEDNETYDIYDDKFNVIGTETFKEKMIRLKGEMNDEDADISDAYYGVTHYGWELVKEGISIEEMGIIKNAGINIEVAK